MESQRSAVRSQKPVGKPKAEALKAETGAERAGDASPALLTTEELALALKVSLRTVERMLAEGEITAVRLRSLVRFYLPDVVRQLVATALTRKRGPLKKPQASSSK
jgi:excisionase family DNA binding protein